MNYMVEILNDKLVAKVYKFDEILDALCCFDTQRQIAICLKKDVIITLYQKSIRLNKYVTVKQININFSI